MVSILKNEFFYFSAIKNLDFLQAEQTKKPSQISINIVYNLIYDLFNDSVVFLHNTVCLSKLVPSIFPTKFSAKNITY